jgi:hypothetical protein
VARWSKRPRSKPRERSWQAQGPIVAFFNVNYIDGFDGFVCGCEYDHDDRYMACMTCGRCEEHCDCMEATTFVG